MRKRRVGLSLVETLVVVALFSMIALAMVAFYRSAAVEFEAGSARMATSQHGRLAIEKIGSMLSGATPRRPTGAADAFYRPDLSEMLVEMEYCDFLSNQKFIDVEGAPQEVVYAFDRNLPATGYSTLFRYRIVWTPTGDAEIPANAVFVERLELGPGTPTRMDNTRPRILARHISSCRFRRLTAASMQVTVNVYGEDPNTGRQLDGALSRGLNRQRRNVLFHLSSAIPLPALTLTPP